MFYFVIDVQHRRLAARLAHFVEIGLHCSVTFKDGLIQTWRSS